MKKLDRIILEIFSILIFLKSVLVICLIFGWIDINVVEDVFEKAIFQEEIARVILVIDVVFLICATKCIFFDSTKKEDNLKGILMQNDNGKLLISKSTIENIVISAVKEFDSTEDVSVSTELDDQNSLIINIMLVVNQNVIIKDLTLNMQNKVKDAIKRTSDLSVKEVNVKIKNITTADKNRQE